MNRKLVLTVLGFTFATFAATRIGPAIGDAVTRNDSLPWHLLPWALLVAIGGMIFAWTRRAQRRP